MSSSVFLNRRDASRYRDLDAFLPGLELFLKLYNSLNSALIGYQLVNKNDWKCNSRIFYTSLVFCCWKKFLKHILLGQTNRDRDSNVKIFRQPGLEAQKVEKHWSSWQTTYSYNKYKQRHTHRHKQILIKIYPINYDKKIFFPFLSCLSFNCGQSKLILASNLWAGVDLINILCTHFS